MVIRCFVQSRHHDLISGLVTAFDHLGERTMALCSEDDRPAGVYRHLEEGKYDCHCVQEAYNVEPTLIESGELVVGAFACFDADLVPRGEGKNFETAVPVHRFGCIHRIWRLQMKKVVYRGDVL